ncbi:MAG: transcriptional repressor [Anaerolinea sp.]|nr:transcriptional repressor [Anaerolinea sp.]MCC6972814.1 transcriptional repressor [Anaerolineae bacterium]CAG1003128.1 Ferric uptake regulation protein [Anaerolineae bacterium]
MLDKAQTVLSQIEARGERLTIQRRVVIEVLCTSDSHLTIPSIQRQIEANFPKVGSLSEATIYRILEWLKKLGLVSQTDLGEAGITYSLLDHPRHHHLICLNCGMVFELDDTYFADLRQKLLADYGFLARIDHMAVYGQCKGCASDHEGASDPV